MELCPSNPQRSSAEVRGVLTLLPSGRKQVDGGKGKGSLEREIKESTPDPQIPQQKVRQMVLNLKICLEGLPFALYQMDYNLSY